MANPEQLAYVAGFFDGEGSIHIYMKHEKYACVQLSMTQTDRTVLDWAVQVLGYGKVYGPYKPSNGLSKKDKYVIRIGRRVNVVAVLTMLQPYMIVKRARVAEALAHLDV